MTIAATSIPTTPNTNGPVSAGSPTAARGPAGHPGQVRAGDRADGGRPDHDGQRPGTAAGRGEVGGGVPRLVVRGAWSSRAGRRREQQRERSETPAEHAQRRAGGAEQVPERRARAGVRGAPISRASRNDATAAPSTCIVCTSPASSSEPEISSASIAATAMPTVLPRPPSAWATTRVQIVRRCTWRMRWSGQRTPPTTPRAKPEALSPTQPATRRPAPLPGGPSDGPTQRSLGGRPRVSQTARHTFLGLSPASSACTTVRPPSPAITCSRDQTGRRPGPARTPCAPRTRCAARQLPLPRGRTGRGVHRPRPPRTHDAHAHDGVERTSYRWWTTSCRW